MSLYRSICDKAAESAAQRYLINIIIGQAATVMDKVDLVDYWLVWRSVLGAQGPVSVYRSSSQTKQWRLYSGLLICGGLGLEHKEVEGIRIALAL